MGPASELPHPDFEFDKFIKVIKDVLATQPKVVDPVSLRKKPWLDVSKLRNKYGNPSCVGCAVM